MTLVFDTLRASRALREAGVDERQAEAIVGIVQQSAPLPDIGHLATKTDLELLEGRIKTELSEKLRAQGWQLLGGVAAIVGFATAIIKLVP